MDVSGPTQREYIMEPMDTFCKIVKVSEDTIEY